MKAHARSIGVAETCVSSIILLVLVIVTAGVFVKQFHYDRAMFLAAAPSAAPAEPHVPSVPGDSFVELPGDLKPLSAPEIFTPDNLYDKIDGKAELYVSAGVLGMRCQQLALRNDSNAWMEFFAYDMGSLRQSFAVYSMQQRADGQPLHLTIYSYKTQNALFFCCGRYYVEAVTALPTEAMMSAMMSVARLFVARNPAQETRLAELDLFPTERLVPNSDMFQPADAFDFDKFRNVFSAKCTMNGAEVMVFLTVCDSPEEASGLRTAYHRFLLTNGGRELPGTDKGPDAKLAEILGTVDLVFSHDKVVAGVHAASSSEVAEQTAALLDARISEANP